jgi:hypothetical protein
MSRIRASFIPQNYLIHMSEADKKTLGHSTAEPSEYEAPFQSDAEKWLNYRGYWSRTEKNIAAGPPPMGWYMHFRKAKGNPLVLDLIIQGNNGRWFEPELKSATGRTLKHQRELIEQSEHCCSVRTMDEFKAAVNKWENGRD